MIKLSRLLIDKVYIGEIFQFEFCSYDNFNIYAHDSYPIYKAKLSNDPSKMELKIINFTKRGIAWCSNPPDLFSTKDIKIIHILSHGIYLYKTKGKIEGVFWTQQSKFEFYVNLYIYVFDVIIDFKELKTTETPSQSILIENKKENLKRTIIL